mmetsp:Transcript_35830/g.93806  ORF Transcript_35830/g.93806 Transcript_35830/m.93806 type:complete len:206 (-) Transcript_35830:279-896(-)
MRHKSGRRQNLCKRTRSKRQHVGQKLSEWTLGHFRDEGPVFGGEVRLDTLRKPSAKRHAPLIVIRTRRGGSSGLKDVEKAAVDLGGRAVRPGDEALAKVGTLERDRPHYPLAIIDGRVVAEGPAQTKLVASGSGTKGEHELGDRWDHIGRHLAPPHVARRIQFGIQKFSCGLRPDLCSSRAVTAGCNGDAFQLARIRSLRHCPNV